MVWVWFLFIEENGYIKKLFNFMSIIVTIKNFFFHFHVVYTLLLLMSSVIFNINQSSQPLSIEMSDNKIQNE